MDKESFPAQLNADYYRRKNLNISMASQGQGGHQQHYPVAAAHHPDSIDSGASNSNSSANQHQIRGRAPSTLGSSHGIMHRLVTKVASFASRSLRVGGAVVGIVTVANLASYYYDSKQVDAFFGASIDSHDSGNDDNGVKYEKRVLVLPLDNLKVIERCKPGSSFVENYLSRFSDPNQRSTMTIEVKELISILHSAASNPNICALYATFGEGDGLGGMRHPIGYAHLEEIRNAVRIFNESHRVHRDPNVHHNPVYALARNGNPKQSYAFGHAFQWREFFLASAFTNLHLQSRGHLHLFGVTMNNLFLGGLLDKYGIKAHVFRHGEYKNAPSVFTDKKYSKTNLETVKSITSSVNETFRTCIESSRAVKFDSVMWRSIFEYGSLRAMNSAEIGLVDCTPPVDPLLSLVDTNQGEAKEKQKKSSFMTLFLPGEEDDNDNISDRAQFVEKFGKHDSFSRFTATEVVSLAKYRQMLSKRKRVERIRMKINGILHRLYETSTATSYILSAMHLLPEHSSSAKCDKIAVVTVDGAIGGTVSCEITRSIKQIGKDKDVKAVILRVNSPGGSVVSSEAILEEIKLLDKPVICSMSNAAASGGYYISMNAEKIFASSTTLTGSIGVFGIKFDASKWANSYGITGAHYPQGSHGATMHPLTPLTPSMKNNIARIVLDYYDYFKGIVSAGRCLSLNEVENVAQGRVWTGEQAKEVGLIDALGGLDRAISYAKRTHTNTKHVEVHHYPKRLSLWDNLSSMESLYVGYVQSILNNLFGLKYILDGDVDLSIANKPHVMMAMDEMTAIEIILRGK